MVETEPMTYPDAYVAIAKHIMAFAIENTSTPEQALELYRQIVENPTAALWVEMQTARLTKDVH